MDIEREPFGQGDPITDAFAEAVGLEPSIVPDFEFQLAIVARLKEITLSRFQERDERSLLTPSEVAGMMRVDPKTVTRYARAGKINAIRTLGGHRRFYYGKVIDAMVHFDIEHSSEEELLAKILQADADAERG